MNTKKLHLSGEIALLIVLLINSLGVDLMSKSEFGISTGKYTERQRRLPHRLRSELRSPAAGSYLPSEYHDALQPR